MVSIWILYYLSLLVSYALIGGYCVAKLIQWKFFAMFAGIYTWS